MSTLVPYGEALARLAALGRIRRVERVPLAEALGRVLAADLVAREELPPFDNTAVDGFALRAADVQGASAERPVRLRIGATVFAGPPSPSAEATAADAVRIMTGAPMPDGCDTTIKVEDALVERDGATEWLLLRAPIPAGANVRRRGEDVRRGQRLVAAPRLLTSGLLAVAAGQGVGVVDVLARPLLRLVATGDELVEDPDRPLGPGQIRNTSLPFLLAEASRLGLPAEREGLMPDREDDAVERVGAWLAGLRGKRLDGAADPAVPHVAVSTGAVSAGERDFVPAMLRRLGFEIVVHGIAVRPGKPVLVARHPDAPFFWFGLPGNVLSTAAAFRFFAVPFLRSLLGLDPEPTRQLARLTADFLKPSGLRFFARGVLRSAEDGALEFAPEQRQGSGMLSALAGTNAYAVMAEDLAWVPAGTVVPVVADHEPL